jgi:guanosine-3',5'-bis(diphosphate) 3'-pyrophosphohydrolase
MDYLKSCEYSIRLINRLREFDKQNKLDFELINKAIYWAKKYHDGQFRKSGEPFYTHPLEVAYMISEYSIKTDVIVTSILHDIVEDTEVTVGMIVDAFGWRIAEMVDRLTRDRPDGTKLSVEDILDNACSKNDKEVILIKITDRLHNMNTISSLRKEKIEKTTHETLRHFLISSIFIENKNIENLLLHVCYKQLKIEEKSIEWSLPIVLKDSDLISLISQND